MSRFSAQELGSLRAIALPTVLRAAEAQPDPRNKAKWHTVRGIISITGHQFFNWKENQGGGGAIDLAMHLHSMSFHDAVHWLRHLCPQPRPPADLPKPRMPSLLLPIPDPLQLSAIEHYLTAVRRIPAATLAPLIRSERLYADHRRNAVFLLLGKQRRPVGAELRGTGAKPWHGLATGSRKDRGCFYLGPRDPQAFVLCESAIDAISCFCLHPHCCCLSTAGARPQPGWLPSLLAKGPAVYCGFDHDPTGEAMAQAMIANYPSVQRLRPPQHDWNDTLYTHRSRP